MYELPTQSSQTDSARSASNPIALERRRPGRVENINPVLLPLLRRADPETDRDHDDRRPTTGMAVALILSAPIWVIISLAVRYWIG